MSDSTYSALRQAVGRPGFLEGADVGTRYHSDPRGIGETVPPLVLRPASTQEVSKILAICHRDNQPVVVQGGLTGLVVGARPRPGEIVISFERMNRIGSLSVTDCVVEAEAGTPLQAVQEAADAAGLMFPLDLGARGSATIGGNLATNAGGNRVLRYGMIRDLTLGIEVVLADGTVVSSLNRFLKNNTGYDLKQLFIGSEGTLGLVTRASLRLFRKPRTQTVAFCGLDTFEAVTDLLEQSRIALGADLSAFEVMWASVYEAIAAEVPETRPPLTAGHAFYVLIETLGSDPEADEARVASALEPLFEAGVLADAVISRSQAEAEGLWAVRDALPRAMAARQPTVGFDISVAIADMAQLETELLSRLSSALGPVELYIGGHLADGNLHLVARTKDMDIPTRRRIEEIVYGFVGEIRGSISAEHGIGTLKRPYLGQSRSAEEIALMRTLKATLDPRCILNPGRVLECDPPRD